MPRRLSEDTLWSGPIPLTDLGIGRWEDDGLGGEHSIRGDATLAHMYGLTEEEAARGFSFAQLQSIFHPGDLDQDTEMRRRVRETGGLFVWEHRIVPEPGVERWVLVRGHFERGPDGRVRGRGIAVDITHTRIDGHTDGPARFMEAYESATPLEAAADHAIRIWKLLDDLGAAKADRLRPVVEALLRRIAREIARTLPEGPETEVMRRPIDPKLH